MSLEKTLKKVLSVTLVAAFMLQQTGFVFAATDESTWTSLKTDVEATAGEYNVTTALTADEEGGSGEGTISITADGNTITGASLTQNSTNDPLFNVGSAVTSFNLGNDVSGSIVNDGTMTYTGSSLADGTVTGSGKFVFGGTTTNANTITQTTVETTTAANVTNNAAVTATTFTNKGTFDNNAMITASISNESGATLLTGPANLGGAVANEGIVKLNADGNLTQNITGTAGKTEIRADVNNQATISQDTIKVGTGSALTSDADNLVATTEIFNDGTLNLTAGTNANAINGDGDVVFSNTVTNNGAVVQTSVASSGALTNNAAITAKLTNTGTIGGTGSVKLTADSSSTGNIEQDGFDTNGFDFSNTAALTTNATFVNSATFSGVGGTLTLAAGTASNAGTITQDAVSNAANFTNTGTVTTDALTNTGDITGNGTLNINGDSSNSGTIAQSLVAVSNNATFTNTGLLLAKANNAAGSTLDSDPDNLGDDVVNAGTLNLNNGGTLSVAVTGTGDTNINGDLNNQGSISQDNINIGAGYVVTSNASDMTATTAINNAGTINYTAGSTANTITGAGRVDITGYVTNTGDITQTTVSNSGVFTNNGTVTANLENTKTIEGTGDIVTGTGISSNTGTLAQANLTNNGTFDNTGHITLTGALTNADTFNTNADLLAAAGGVANAGNLNITGGTNANVITGAGVTNFTGDATNNAAITQTTVTNTAKLTNNALITADVTNSGTLTSDGANIAGDIANTGSYIITGGNNANDIIGAGGKTTILGNTTNTGTIMQESLAIANSGNLTTDSDLITAAITNDGKLVWNAGTANQNVIDGTGELHINGADIVNSSTISQDNIKVISGSLTSNADLLASAKGITNNDGLTFTGGTNANVISGTGDLTTTGNVTNNAAISQNTITVTSGKLTTAADTLTTVNGVVNNSEISFTGGDNNNDISGTGTTYIDGTVQNLASIDTVIQVNTGAHYGTATDILKKLDNRGTTDLIDADIASTGKISGTGVTNILGATVNNSSISQSAVNIAAGGSLTTDSQKVEAAITNDGDLIWNAGNSNANAVNGNGNLNITGGTTIANTASISQGNITITGGALSTDAGLLASASGITNNADLTFTGGTNANAITGTGDLITTGDVTNNAAISQNSITVSGGKLTTAADALTTVAGITNNSEISLTGGDNLNDISGTGLTYIDGTVTNAADITTDIQINAGANLGTLNDIVSTVENRGLLQIVDADITSTGKVKGTGDVNILGDTTNSGKINATTVNVVVGSHLTTDSDKVEASIVNDGDLTWNAGTANANVISGTGALEITSGTTIANTATISQADITITNGALSTDAGLLATVNGITNNDGLTFTGGTNTNAISGTGDLTATGNVTNQAAIAQATVTNSGTLANEGTITADVTNTGVLASDGDDITGDIANSGTYVITDGDNANDITGTGDVQIEGTTINIGTIAQDNIFVAAGASLVASDISDITTTTGIDNAGVLELQSGANANVIGGNTGTLKITGVVTNNAGVNINQDTIDIATLGDFTANAGNLKTVNGITNSGALTLGDGATANNISGTGTLAVTGTVTNTGNMDQKSLNITGALQSNADLLAFADGITNTGTLDLTDGTNANVITGTGTTNFTNDVINNGEITQATVTNDAGTLTNNAAITATFVNNTGTVNNEAAITGAITNTSGTINSTADNLVGVVTNNGTLNVAGGTVQNTISGAGTMNITDDLVNAQNINQTTVNNSANMTNSGAITADFNNSGVVDNTAAITGAITNSGTINSTATNLVGAVNNTGTLNLDGGTTQGAISGAGDTNITADLTNNFAINQTNVTNTAALTNNATITATDITNSGTITGAAANLVVSNEIANSGSLIFNAASTGASNISGAGDVQVTANTTLTGANDYTGGTLIDAATLTVAGASNIGTGDVTFANNGILDVTAAGSLDNNLVGQTPASDDVTVQNAAALTLNGNIGAAKDFHKAGAGAMTLAMASNTYTGDTYVDGGTLIGNTGNINNTVNGAAGTTVEFTDTTDAELNAINTLGTFVQSGSAKLNVQTNAFSANQADINAGIFAANRALTANTLNVNTGAKLQGNGNITGNVNVNTGATLAPGNSIDTLTITGNLNLASGSTTAIEITDTPASDKVVVTGNANIAGGANLTVSNVSGRYFEWESFDIMEAANVAGTFTYDGSVTDYDTSRINVDVDYSDPTKVTLTAKRKATTYGASPAGALSRNEREVAQAIDAVSTGFGGDITNALLQLEQLGGLNPTGVVLIDPSATFQSALNNLAGSLYANSAMLPLFNAKTAHVYDRIAKRNPSTGACPTCHDNVWVEYYNQYDKVYANQNSSRFTNNMTGVMAGYDRSSDELLLGIYGGYGESDLRQLNDKMDIEDGTLGIYSGYMNGNWLVKGSLFTGRQNYYGKRHITFMGRTATARYEGWNAGLDVEGSYNLAVFDWMNVKPFVGVFGNYAHQQAFTEKDAGALSLHVESHDQVTVQGRLGFQLDGKVFKNRLSWYGSVAVKQIFGNDYAKLHMSFDLPGTRMDILGAELGRTYLSGQVGLNYAITDSLSLYGNLDTGVNDKSANCYGNIGVAYTW